LHHRPLAVRDEIEKVDVTHCRFCLQQSRLAGRKLRDESEAFSVTIGQHSGLILAGNVEQGPSLDGVKYAV